jgi:hypothetical protein
MPPADPRFEIGTCPSCSQGRACIAVSQARQEHFIVCEECFTEWPDPQSFLAMKNATFESHGPYEYMDRGRIARHPWKPFVLNTMDLEG